MTFRKAASNGNPMNVPCGQCIGCRIDYAKMWTARMIHESRQHSDNAFVTLTYSPESLPPSGTLVKRHWQLFMKSLRFHMRPVKIRFYACGEYGEENLRPHYHAILFGYWPNDAKPLSTLPGNRYFTSDTLDTLWGRGTVQVGFVTPETCAYTARYVTKKVNGDRAEKHYQRVIPQTGELVTVIPEFSLMSRKPGLGQRHFEDFQDDIYPGDFVVLNGHKSKVPRYYDRLLETSDPDLHADIKERRILRALEPKVRRNNRPDRLAVRETCLRAKLAPAKRSL